jgi:TetR/AcrR family fatty acid metabolism transcriptional regulator
LYEEHLKRKERIIQSSIEILDELGIQGLTTKEIAKRQSISEPAIYRQFEGKQDIILAILDRFADFDDMIINSIIERELNPALAIEFWVDTYATYYQNYPQITTVLLSFDMFRYQEQTNSRMEAILKKKLDFITFVFQSGIDQKLFKHDLTGRELTEMLFDMEWASIYRWKLDNCKVDLKPTLMKKIKWLLSQIAMEQEE